MAPSSWDSRSEDGEDDTSDPLDQKSAFTLGSETEDQTVPTSNLPPRVLPLRTKTNVVLNLLWTGTVTIVIIVGLSIFAANLYIFLPQTDSYEARDPVSCDLSTSQGGAFQNAFTINLRGAAHLTFAKAKAIDVVWQLFIGAGGRFLLAWISYNVFMDGLLRLIEQSPISYDLYSYLAFSTTSLWATYYGLKGVFLSKGWRSKVFLFWFALATIYVLGFPTLMSATAGYLSPSTYGYNMSDGVFVTPDSPDLQNCGTFENGALCGYTNGTVAEGPPVSQYDYHSSERWRMNLANLDYSKFQKSYPLYYSLVNATYEVTKPIYDATNSSFPPGRGLEVIDPESGRSVPGNADYNFTMTYFIEGRTCTMHNEALNAGFPYCYHNQTIYDLKALAECLPTNYFVWGFSSTMVYINLCLLIIWAFGMYIVWLDANIYSALCRSGRKLRGPFRAVADLSEAMEEVLGQETCAYTNSELARELSKRSGLRYYASDSPENDLSHIGLSSRRLGRVPFNSTKLYGKREKDK